LIANIMNLPHPVSIITFEDYGPVNRTSGKITARAELCGILKQFALRQLGVPIVMIPPNSLKQYATGKGNASKEQMLDAAAKLGYYPDTNDEADAYFAASLGERIIAGNRVGVSFHRVNP
jgi:Holliday junction resolvasome RuvABC endonuclease subunit